MQRLPRTSLPSMILPSSSTSTGSTPKKGRVAEPGLAGVAPGRGVIRMPPVSVCHQVSTMAQRPAPTTSWYHSQTSGLMGSPDRAQDPQGSDGSNFFTHSSPSRAMARMAVGAV